MFKKPQGKKYPKVFILNEVRNTLLNIKYGEFYVGKLIGFSTRPFGVHKELGVDMYWLRVKTDNAIIAGIPPGFCYTVDDKKIFRLIEIKNQIADLNKEFNAIAEHLERFPGRFPNYKISEGAKKRWPERFGKPKKERKIE